PPESRGRRDGRIERRRRTRAVDDLEIERRQLLGRGSLRREAELARDRDDIGMPRARLVLDLGPQIPGFLDERVDGRAAPTALLELDDLAQHVLELAACRAHQRFCPSFLSALSLANGLFVNPETPQFSGGGPSRRGSRGPRSS